MGFLSKLFGKKKQVGNKPKAQRAFYIQLEGLQFLFSILKCKVLFTRTEINRLFLIHLRIYENLALSIM